MIHATQVLRERIFFPGCLSVENRARVVNGADMTDYKGFSPIDPAPSLLRHLRQDPRGP